MLKKLKAGIPVTDYDPLSGGKFSYSGQLINAIDNYKFNDQLDIVFVDLSGNRVAEMKKPLVSFHPFKKFNVRDALRKLWILTLRKTGFSKSALNNAEEAHARVRDKYIDRELARNNIDVLFYVNPDGHQYKIPFITTHWDIAHKSTFLFPEFERELPSRLHYYEHVLPQAAGILTETEAGKEELLLYTDIPAKKIDVMPMFPGVVVNEDVTVTEQIDILSTWELEKNKFFFYPAQFWAHKNHKVLIEAFANIYPEHPELKMIFTGSDKGELANIKALIEEKRLTEAIIIPGFVSNKVLFTLYKNALAMVMPTYLGPSNMPPLEAAVLGCPVILSDLKGHREMIGEYGVYFHPADAEALTKLLKDAAETQREEKPFTNRDKFNIDNTVRSLENFLTAHSWQFTIGSMQATQLATHNQPPNG